MEVSLEHRNVDEKACLQGCSGDLDLHPSQVKLAKRTVVEINHRNPVLPRHLVNACTPKTPFRIWLKLIEYIDDGAFTDRNISTTVFEQ